MHLWPDDRYRSCVDCWWGHRCRGLTRPLGLRAVVPRTPIRVEYWPRTREWLHSCPTPLAHSLMTNPELPGLGVISEEENMNLPANPSPPLPRHF